MMMQLFDLGFDGSLWAVAECSWVPLMAWMACAGVGIGRSEVFAIVDVLDFVSLAGVKQSVGRAEKRIKVKQSR
jgi:hypothetical protein